MSLLVSERWFSDVLIELPGSSELRAYVVGVLNKYVGSSIDDLSKTSVVFAFAEAKNAGPDAFAKYQQLGDWVLWINSFAPAAVKPNVAIVEMMGRQSYDACYRLMQRQWKIYEELADRLPAVTRAVHSKLVENKIAIRV